jgi:hypothetical protein
MFTTHFDRYVCEGDSISCEVNGIEYTARLVHDWDFSPEECDCYSEADIEAWRNDEWHYFGVVISAEFGGVELGDHLASLWGIEGNFGRSDTRNDYFLEVANELLPEAREEAEKVAAGLLNALKQRNFNSPVGASS